MATGRNNLGGAWDALGEYHKSIGYYEQALAIFEARLGGEHPNTRTVRENLEVLKAQLAADGDRDL